MANYYYSRVFPNGATTADAPKAGDMVIRDGRPVIVGAVEPQDAKRKPFVLARMEQAKNAEIEADGLVYTAKKAGNAGNNLKVVHKAYKSAHEAGVSVKGNIITVVLETDSKGGILTDADALYDIINGAEDLPVTLGIEIHSEIKANEYKLAGGEDVPAGQAGELRWDDNGLYLCNGEDWLTIKEW